MAEIWIDGESYEADPQKNLLDVCLGLGFDLPYFCWHPALGSVGACRQCAVKQYKSEEDRSGTLVMACMTPAAPGTRISIADPEARELRKSVIEWLMVNHPHDCPVCDEGGECHLQDMTVMTGHAYRRYRFRKKTYRNQYLGPLINHEMNRCIQCYRCVRFYADYAGGRDLQVLGAHDHVYFGRHQDGVLESEFSGNLVEVCPTGVFTDKSLKRHYTRKWDLQCAPSVCVHCSLGCNTTPGERYGGLRRIRARYNGQVNGYFLCDRGRYGYEFTNDERRIRVPLLPLGKDEPARGLSKREALDHLAKLLAHGDRVLGIGSPRASLESNYALRALVGPERFFRGIGEREAGTTDAVLAILRGGPARTPPLREVEQCDAVLLLGEDPSNSAPLLALALRQSVRQEPLELARQNQIPLWHDAAVRELVQERRGPFYVASTAATRLDDVATALHRATPADLARLGFAVAHALDPASPEVHGLPARTQELAVEIAARLLEAQRPLVVSGTSSLSEPLLQAAANIAWALSRRRRSPADLVFTLPECNSLGLALLGGATLESALATLELGHADALVILENDLYRRAEPELVDRLLATARHVVVLDHLATPTGERAELFLPAATFAEGDGTLVNNEGRAQRCYQVFVPEGAIQESWRWLGEAMQAAGRRTASWSNQGELAREAAGALPALRGLPGASVPAQTRWAGARLPREPHRYSGRTALRAHRDVHESPPPSDPDSPLSFSMEGYTGTPPARLASDFWSPGWNSIQALNRFQEEIAGPLRDGDPGVRLLEPDERAEAPYFAHVPPGFERRPGQWRLLPLHHAFGSEELSSLAPGIAELAPAPYLALGSEDAAELGVETPGSKVTLELDGRAVELPVVVRPELPRGLAGIGVIGALCAPLPAWGRITRAPR